MGDRIEEGLAALEGRLRGRLHRPGDDGYAAGLRIWNAMIERRPAAVVAPSGEADIADTVLAARELDLPLSIRGGGHNVAGLAVCEGGLMLDLSARRGVHVDPGTRRVRVEPGACWADVDRETQRHGLAVPSGLISATGVAGLTLGGGFGWTSRALGLTCDSLRSADVVTADGATARAAPDAHDDLFWGLRGGGGNFGVVSSFEFEAHPVGPSVHAGIRWFPMDRAPEVLEAFAAQTAAAPRELGSLLVLRRAPAGPPVPEWLQGRPAVGVAVCYTGGVESGPDHVQPLTALDDPAADVLGPKPFAAFQQALDPGQPFGRRYYWKTHYLPAWEHAAGEVLAEHAARVPSPHSAILCFHLGGAIADVPDGDSAVANREAQYVVNIQGAWEERGDDAVNIEWVRDCWDAVAPWGQGQYVNFLAEDAVRTSLEAAYGRDRLARLAGIKSRWDPGNLFRMNHNIPPA